VDVDSTHASGVWWRHVSAGADVYFEPPDPADSRWQRGAIVEALYFADSEATAWAEWYRYLAEAGVAPEQGLPRDLWRWEISLSEIADLGTRVGSRESACRLCSRPGFSGRPSSSWGRGFIANAGQHC
jgi:hypothetical protein